jgi:deoxyribose-phosphate aldolase
VGSNVNLDDYQAVAGLIDHTLLKPDATMSQISQLCLEAREWNFAALCVNPCWVSYASEQLSGSATKVCTVIGFPLGANDTQVKLEEARVAIASGARELDMVQNIGWLRSNNVDAVRDEIRRLAAVAHEGAAILKVILETSLLSDDLKVTACVLALEAGADFVKTCTGFGGGGATVADVKLMRRTVDHKMGVKASGGVRTFETLQQLVRAGASRIGTSSGVSILREITSGAPRQGGPEAAY